MDIKLSNEYFHLKGFEITRKIVMEGDRRQMPDMLHELADILAELEDGDDIKITGVLINNNDKHVKFTVTFVKEP